MSLSREALSKLSKEDLAQTIWNQALLAGFIIKGTSVSKEVFQQYLKERAEQHNGGKDDLIDLFTAMTDRISKMLDADRSVTSKGNLGAASSGVRSTSSEGPRQRARVTLDPNLPKFGGDREELASWLFQVDNFIQYNEVPNEDA